VSKQTGKGSQRRRQALERKATQHHDVIGEAGPERAEAEFRKHERLEEERNVETVREMAKELEQVAGVSKGDGAIGPELPFRLPRSVEEGKRLIREAPDALRDKARERLEKMPEPAQKAILVAESMVQVMFAPMRIGWALARELMRLPVALLRVLRQQEA